MDIIYYISGTLMTIIFFALVVATILFLIKPHYLNKSKHINSPVSRQKIFVIGLISIFITLFGFSGVMAATEPANVKQARITRELDIQKAEQKIQQEKDAAAKQAQIVETERLRKIEAAKPIDKIETETESIPFELIERNDNTIALGNENISVQGINGERTITYSVTYESGVETARVETGREVTVAPVDQITLVGIYVYVAPAKATTYTTSGSRTGATCKDGSHSSATGSGACSHHGGVAQWLY